MTSQNPRDPGKIAGAFPSRAQGIMANLRDFHQSVMQEEAYAANNPESEAAMRAEANRGKTSGRSPSRVSASQRQQLTGVTERLDQQGWMEAPMALPHLCFPPDTYPAGCGPTSQWRCRCGAIWMARGIAWDEYPVTPTRTEQLLKPERWFYISGGQLTEEDYQAQEGFYDWRPLGPYYVKLYRAMIDNQILIAGMGSKAPVTWEELG